MSLYTKDFVGLINFTTGKSPSRQANQLRYRQISTIRKYFDFVFEISQFRKFRKVFEISKISKKNRKITRMRVNAPFTRIRVNLLEYQLKYLNMSLNTLNFTTDIAGQINFTTGKSPSLQANQLRYRQISTIRNFFDNF